ncbi:MAG: hypothetical protein ACO3EE_11785 [Flavobacteriales bacterium]
MKLTKLFIAASFVIATAAANAQATPVIDHTQKTEKRRIRQGVKSGELDKAEARRLRKEQKRIARTEKRAKADGVVTKEERRRLRREQRAASRHIAKEKHD